MLGLPFRLIPVPKDEAGKAAAFEQVREEVDSHATDAIVLARCVGAATSSRPCSLGALTYHLQNRVLRDGMRTIVFA